MRASPTSKSGSQLSRSPSNPFRLSVARSTGRSHSRDRLAELKRPRQGRQRSARSSKTEQRLAGARIRLNSEGFEQQRQLIELRFQTAQRMAQNELQTETALLNKRRELIALEERQEADRRRAEMQRMALQQALELTRTRGDCCSQELASVDMTQITGAIQSFGQGSRLRLTRCSSVRGEFPDRCG